MALVMKRIALGGMLLIGTLTVLIAVGYAMDDPGGWAGAAISAAWVVPTVLLTWAAWTRPALGARILVPLVVLVALARVVLPFASERLREFVDGVGPVFALATVAVAVATAALGLHRTGIAGWLLACLAIINGAGVYAQDVARGGGGPGPLGLLSTSGGVLTLPMLVAGALLVAADRLEHRRPSAPASRPTHV